eukprot:356244-Chlamydomonas_euryale.AAC.2
MQANWPSVASAPAHDLGAERGAAPAQAATTKQQASQPTPHVCAIPFVQARHEVHATKLMPRLIQASYKHLTRMHI